MSPAFDIVDGAEEQSSAPLRGLSIKDRIRSDLAARRQADQRRIAINHEGAPHLRVTFRVPDDAEELADLTAKAEKKSKTAPGAWFNRLMVAKYAERIEYDGVLLTSDQHGGPLTFASPELLDLFGAVNAGDCVRQAYGSDAYVAAVAIRLMAEGGFGDGEAVDVEDPTQTG